jgi:hypothetical protein
MWRRVLGADTDATAVDFDWYESFIDQRLSGEINARGKLVPVDKRKPVRIRTVETDVLWLVWVYYWGARFKERRQDKRRLLPTGLVNLKELRQSVDNWPEVENVRRPVSTATRYEKVRAVAAQVTMETYVNGKRKRVPSYLREILDLAHHTGRRLSAILNLRHGDYCPDAEDEQGRELPYGAVTWRGEFDKQGKEWVSALNKEAQAAIQRIRKARPGVGEAPLFPSRDDPMQPLCRHVADNWLRKAEKLARLESQDGTLWHGYRRGWATARQHFPPTMTAHTGGWKSPETMQKCYQQTGLADQLQVVTAPVEVREKQA